MRNKRFFGQPCSVGNKLSFASCPVKTGPRMARLLAFPSTMIGCRCKPEVFQRACCSPEEQRRGECLTVWRESC